jgi:hypothetical protein
MKNIFLLILICFTLSGFSQLYFGDKHNTYYYVEIKGDSAHLEVFKDELYSVYKTDETTLNKNQDPNIPFGSYHKIIKSKDKLNLLYKNASSNDVTKIELRIAPKDNRELLRKEAYYCKKNKTLSDLQDSLAGPTHRSTYTIERNNDSTVSSRDYIKSTDLIMDSLSKQIVAAADKTALSFYADIDSLYALRPNDIFNLLNKAKYEFHYGRSLVYSTATMRPEVLIQFVDKNTVNKPTILRVIRDHRYHDAIIAKVKAYPVESYAKSEIIKQKRRKTIKDRAGKGVFAALIVAEIGLIAALIITALK